MKGYWHHRAGTKGTASFFFRNLLVDEEMMKSVGHFPDCCQCFEFPSSIDMVRSQKWHLAHNGCAIKSFLSQQMVEEERGEMVNPSLPENL